MGRVCYVQSLLWAEFVMRRVDPIPVEMTKVSNAKLFLFAGPKWYLMHELERAMYLNENTKTIFEIGSKVKKLWDVKHVYRWYLFVTSFSLLWQKHVLHCKNINLLISKRLNGLNNMLVILQICDSIKRYHKFIVTMIFPFISKP